MTRPKTSIGRSFCVALLVPLAVLATGCRPSTRSATSGKLSTVFEGGYDPVAVLRQQGYVVQTEARGEQIRNAVAGYGWQSWYGVLVAPQDRKGCEAIAVLIRDSLNQATIANALDELTGRTDRSGGRPLAGMLRYNKDGMHGDMHVWLIPDASETTISYVIFLREERL